MSGITRTGQPCQRCAQLGRNCGTCLGPPQAAGGATAGPALDAAAQADTATATATLPRVGEYAGIPDVSEVRKRFDQLPDELRTYGSSYNRSFTSAWNDANQFLEWGDAEAALIYLRNAEYHAGRSSLAKTNITGTFSYLVDRRPADPETTRRVEEAMRVEWAKSGYDWPGDQGMLVMHSSAYGDPDPVEFCRALAEERQMPRPPEWATPESLFNR